MGSRFTLLIMNPISVARSRTVTGCMTWRSFPSSVTRHCPRFRSLASSRRRGNRYHGIVLDPPAYGRGANGEKWILEDNICEMLECCARLLEPRGAFLVLNLYSMGLSSTLARTAVRQAFGAPRTEQYGELCFTDRAGKQLPLGTYYRFTR